MTCNQPRKVYDIGDKIIVGGPRTECFLSTQEIILKINDDGQWAKSFFIALVSL